MQLLCVGEAFADLIFMDIARMPRAGEELRTRRFAATAGGGAVITAVAASRLGLRSRIISALGADVVRRLRRERVGIVNLSAPGEDGAISGAISTAHDRSFVTFDGVNEQLERRLLARAGSIRAPYVHFALGPRHCARWAGIVERLRAAGSVTSWDFGWHDDLTRRRGLGRLLASIDYLFLNEREAVHYARTPTLRAAVDVWRRRPGSTIVKLGEAGSRWLSADRDLHVPVRPLRAVDTTGAGDAFNGGFLTGLARGLTPLACLRLANRVGAASTQRPGGLDGLPTR